MLYFGANIIANFWLQIPEAEYTLKSLSPAIFFVSISSVMRGYFNGRKKISATANSQTIEQVFKTVLTIIIVEIIAIFSQTNTELMAAGANLATTISTFLSFSYIYNLYRINQKEEIIEFPRKLKKEKVESVRIIIKKIMAVSIPITLSAILSSVNKNIDSITVVRILKPIIGEANAKAKYGILSSKVDILTAMPLAFNIAFATSLVPEIASAKIKNDINTINKRLRFSLLVTILIGLPCTFGMAIFSKQILQLLFPNASLGEKLLTISSFSIIFSAMVQTINGALQGIGKIKICAIALGCGVIVKLFTNILLIPINGIYENGSAIGTVFCQIVSFLIVYNALKKSLRLDFSIFKLMIKPIIITCIMSIISYNIYIYLIKIGINYNVCTIIGIIVAIISYVIFIFLFKIFEKEDIFMMPNGEKIYKILKIMKIYE